MPRVPNWKDIDRALAIIAPLAAKSGKLSAEEKQELTKLGRKAVSARARGLTHPERIRCIYLIRKASPDRLPNVPLPPWLRDRLGGDAGRSAPEIRAPSGKDPLERLEALGRMRGGVVSEEQFERQKAALLADPDLDAFGAAEGVDPISRVERVDALARTDVLTADEAADLADRILRAS